MPELCSFEANATNVSNLILLLQIMLCGPILNLQLRLTISHDNGKCEFTMELKLYGVSCKLITILTL